MKGAIGEHTPLRTKREAGVHLPRPRRTKHEYAELSIWRDQQRALKKLHKQAAIGVAHFNPRPRLVKD